jgi:two-component system, NtrC family, sensor kinase
VVCDGDHVIDEARRALPVVVVAAPEDLGSHLAASLSELSDGAYEVEVTDSGAGLLSIVDDAMRRGSRVPLVAVCRDLPDGRAGDVLAELDHRRETSSIRTMLVIREDEPAGDDSVRRSLVDAVLAVPWSESQLRHSVHRLITQFFVDAAPEAMEDVSDLVDVDVLSHAFAESEDRRRETEGQLRTLRRGFLGDRDLTDDEVEATMIAEIDRVLDHPERETIAEGTVLLRSGDPVPAIRIVLEGRVRLTLEVEGREEVFYSRTAGRIIGLLAMARSQPSFFNVIAATDLTVITIPIPDLDRAFQRSPMLAVHFVTVLLRSLARRNLRGAEMRARIGSLNRDLEQERDQLATALRQLRDAQSRLVESEKLATLGQLVAGIGHELNNPVAAISRAVAFLRDDVDEIAGRDDAPYRDILQRALSEPPRSTRDERRSRDRMAEALGDPDLARRLARIGVDDPAGFEARADREVHLERLELFHRVGSSLRALTVSSERIAGLVRSLRSYARPTTERIDDLDVRDGIEETLLLLGHELFGMTVERDYAADLPRVSGYPGELNQVWTNLIANAIEAMEGEGTLRIEVDAPPGEVRVRVIDSGPGIDPAHLHRIFEPSFTTKDGRVAFGLGLGLQIAKDIVVRHDGSIRAESEPGRTCFTVRLPAPKEG